MALLYFVITTELLWLFKDSNNECCTQSTTEQLDLLDFFQCCVTIKRYSQWCCVWVVLYQLLTFSVYSWICVAFFFTLFEVIIITLYIILYFVVPYQRAGSQTLFIYPYDYIGTTRIKIIMVQSSHV